jgi:hypothetical protein
VAPPATSTTTMTSITVSTNVQTTTTVPGWTYATMAVLLVGGVGVGFVVRRQVSAGGK